MTGGGKTIDPAIRQHLVALGMDESRTAGQESLAAREDQFLLDEMSLTLILAEGIRPDEYSRLDNYLNSFEHGALCGTHTAKAMGSLFAQGISQMVDNIGTRAAQGHDYVPVIGLLFGAAGGLSEGIGESVIGLFRDGGSNFRQMGDAVLRAATIEPDEFGRAFGTGIMTVEGAIGMVGGVRTGVGVMGRAAKAFKKGPPPALAAETGDGSLAVAGGAISSEGSAVATSGNFGSLGGFVALMLQSEEEYGYDDSEGRYLGKHEWEATRAEAEHIEHGLKLTTGINYGASKFVIRMMGKIREGLGITRRSRISKAEVKVMEVPHELKRGVWYEIYFEVTGEMVEDGASGGRFRATFTYTPGEVLRPRLVGIIERVGMHEQLPRDNPNFPSGIRPLHSHPDHYFF